MCAENASGFSRPDFLAECPAFASLPSIALELLASYMHERPFKTGEQLIRQGEPGDSLIIIVNGRTEVVVHDDLGNTLRLARTGRGEVLGEMALLTNEPRNADVLALTDGVALVLPAEAFKRLAARQPTVSVVLTDLAARRLGSGEFDALRGKVLDRYRIRRCLGRGGMAVVYEAESMEDGRRVALKMMNHRLVYDPQILQRFQREADIVESLRHENIAAMYGRFAAYNTYFLVMEFCDGPTLSEIIGFPREIPEDQVRKIAGQLARALEHVHGNGVVHRDLKPSNVMITRDGTLKLMDFGIAKPDSPSDLTRSGMVLGTPRYMPPEQLGGKPVNTAADVYAFGCLLFTLLTAESMFDGDDITQVLYQKLTWKLPPARAIRKGLSNDLYGLLKRSLATEPEKRTVDWGQLGTWAGPVATAELYPFPVGGDSEMDPTKTLKRDL